MCLATAQQDCLVSLYAEHQDSAVIYGARSAGHCHIINEPFSSFTTILESSDSL